MQHAHAGLCSIAEEVNVVVVSAGGDISRLGLEETLPDEWGVCRAKEIGLGLRLAIADADLAPAGVHVEAEGGGGAVGVLSRYLDTIGKGRDLRSRGRSLHRGRAGGADPCQGLRHRRARGESGR